jgi:hypothetical protein
MELLVTLTPTDDDGRWMVSIAGQTVGILEHEQNNTFFLLLSHPNPKRELTNMMRSSESLTELLDIARQEVV